MNRTLRWYQAYNDLMKARRDMAAAAAELLRLKAEREGTDGVA